VIIAIQLVRIIALSVIQASVTYVKMLIIIQAQVENVNPWQCFAKLEIVFSHVDNAIVKFQGWERTVIAFLHI